MSQHLTISAGEAAGRLAIRNSLRPTRIAPIVSEAAGLSPVAPAYSSSHNRIWCQNVTTGIASALVTHPRSFREATSDVHANLYADQQ